jgi:hypothetical protein
MDFIVEIPGLVPETVTVALKEDLTITDDLTVEIDRCAAQFGYYAVLAERANARLQRLKFSYDLWLAEVETELTSERKFRLVKDLERKVMLLPKAKLYRIKLLKFEEEARILKQVAKAFEIKKDLIQTKSSNRRSEIGA